MKLPRELAILGLGVLVTLLAGLVWLSGIGSQLEQWCLDWAFRQAPPKTIRDDLVHVDIDDFSLEELGRWPWPRERIAGLIDTLKAAGAECIALDVQFPDPQDIRYLSQAQSVYGAFGEVLTEAPAQPVIDDAALSRSIKAAGNVTLAMYIDFSNPALPPLERDIEAYLRQHLKTSYDQCLAQLGEPDPNAPLSDEEKTKFEAAYFRALRRVFVGEIEAYLQQDPNASYSACAMLIAGFDPASMYSEERHDTFHDAYLSVRGRMSLKRHSRGSLAAPQGQVVPPLLTLAQHAGDAGFATETPDSDGMLRRAQLLGNDGEKTYTQFALSLALQTLQKQYGQPMALRFSGTELQILAGDELVRHIDMEQGGMLINWSLGAGTPDGKKHQRIPARAVANVALEQQRLRDLAKTQYALKTKWISLGQQITDADTEALYWAFVEATGQLDELYKQRIRLDQQDYRNRLYDPAQPTLDAEMRGIAGQERECEKQLFQLTDRLFSTLSGNRDSFLAKPTERPENGDSGEIEDYRQRAEQADDIQAVLAQIPQDRAELEANVIKLQEELASIVAGKICLIGSTATAAADFVPTPLEERTPGINAHASIYDTIVSGELIRPASLRHNLTAILVAGLIVTALALRFNAAVGGFIVTGLAIIYSLLNAHVILPQANLHLAMASPVGTMLCVFVVLTVYKEITEGRQKAFIKQAFKHYLSSHVIEQILHDPQALKLGGEKRELTIMFTDLAGFSSFSERLGPVELTALLNDYLTEMTDIIMEEGGTLDKYEGDAIIAFWNAPLTQPDHAVCACRAVLRCQRRLEELRKAYAEQTGAELRMRVGLNTGEVVVGNMGSTQRFNYTILGDAANLAARLEGANKAFGTETMISENTWRLAASEFQGRKLADLRVVGRKNPMTVYEMTGLSSESAPPEWATFAAGLDQFRAGDFVSAAETFSMLPDDPAARCYVQQCEALVAQPPEDWEGIWELTSK